METQSSAGIASLFRSRSREETNVHQRPRGEGNHELHPAAQMSSLLGLESSVITPYLVGKAKEHRDDESLASKRALAIESTLA